MTRSDLIRRVMLLSHERGREVSKNDVRIAVANIMSTDKETTEEDVLKYLVEYLQLPQDRLRDLHDRNDHH